MSPRKVIVHEPKTLSAMWQRALQGLALGSAAPIGWLIVRMLEGARPSDELATTPGVYAYMLITTSVAFAIFGALIGVREDHLEGINRRLGDLALTDEMTGLRNLRYFQARYEEAYLAAERDSKPLSIAVIDIDHFKMINDRYGHPVGDEVLRATAMALSKVVRRGETLARVGGEEFALLLPGSTARAAEIAGDRVRRALEQQRIHLAGEAEPIRITASVGVASTTVHGYRGRSELYALADEALLRAKETGRNRVEVTGPLPLIRVCV